MAIVIIGIYIYSEIQMFHLSLYHQVMRVFFASLLDSATLKSKFKEGLFASLQNTATLCLKEKRSKESRGNYLKVVLLILN